MVQGWPRNGVQIRKLQNTKDLEKALQISKFRLNLDLKIREICTDKKLSLAPWSGPANKITSKSWGRARRWLRSWKWVRRRDVIHLWKPNPQKGSQITHSWNYHWPFYSFFRWIIKPRGIRKFFRIFEAINLELLLRGFQNIFSWFILWETWSQAWVFFEMMVVCFIWLGSDCLLELKFPGVGA